jgi:hypothetical protein
VGGKGVSGGGGRKGRREVEVNGGGGKGRDR